MTGTTGRRSPDWSGRPRQPGDLGLLRGQRGAAQQVALLHPQADMFSPATSMLVLLAWPAAALVIAAVTITRTET